MTSLHQSWYLRPASHLIVSTVFPLLDVGMLDVVFGDDESNLGQLKGHGWCSFLDMFYVPPICKCLKHKHCESEKSACLEIR